MAVPKYYNPVTSLLMSSDDKTGWQGMRTVAQIRKDRGLEIPVNKDSLYKVSDILSAMEPFYSVYKKVANYVN